MWDADFYVKVDDDVHVNIGKELLPLLTFVCVLFYYFVTKAGFQHRPVIPSYIHVSENGQNIYTF